MCRLSHLKYYTLILFGVLSSARSSAQNIDWKDYNFIKQSNGWLTSENAAGLKELSIENISIAEIGLQKSNGDFVDYYQSNNSLDAGANIESFYRFSPSVVFYGKVGYNVFQGKNMAGSAFTNPERNPFDIVEYSSENKGEKKLETYNLVGAVSADLLKDLSFGAKIDFQAANYAKDKDLRHKNNLLNMFVSAGLSYNINPYLKIGANYYYKRRIEGVEFKTYGTQDKQYFSLINYGAFYGIKETYGSEGYTDSGIENPLFDEYHGVGFQLGIDFSNNLNLYNNFTYKKRDGYFGKQSTTTVVFSEHNSTVLEYIGKLNFKDGNNLHSLDINVQSEKLDNQKNIYKIEKESGEYAQRVIYYGASKVGRKDFFDLSFRYTANIGINDYNPTWVLNAAIDHFGRKQVAYVYPSYRTQSVRQTRFDIAGDRNFVNGDNMYTLHLGLGYQSGKGYAKKDGVYTESTEQMISSSADSILEKEFEFLTADQIKADIGFKYSRILPKIGIKGYTSINYSLVKASKVEFLEGSNFNQFNFTIGCTF